MKKRNHPQSSVELRFRLTSSHWLSGWRRCRCVGMGQCGRNRRKFRWSKRSSGRRRREGREQEEEEKKKEQEKEEKDEEQEEESPVECSGGEAEQLVFIPWEASGTIPYQINKKTQLLSCSS